MRFDIIVAFASLSVSTCSGFGLLSGSSNTKLCNNNVICGSLVSGRVAKSAGATKRFAKEPKKDDEEGGSESWDDNVDYGKEWPKDESSSSPDPTTSWDTPLGSSGLDEMFDDDGTPKLGIDIGKQLTPLSNEEAAEIKAAATELINDAVAAGIDDIERLRDKMRKEIDKTKETMALASDLNMQREKSKLLDKIDRLTGDFLASSEKTRESTKLAARADQAMEGKGFEYGTWGVLGGVTVLREGLTESGALLGSVDAATAAATPKKKKSSYSDDTFFAEPTEIETPTRTDNRLMIVADVSQDKMAKQIIPKFVDKLEEAIPGIVVKTIKPTETMPFGAHDSACVVVFCTSLSDDNSIKNILERALRRTLKGGGTMGQPPTQIVGVSSVGTERYDKMPYSMQNLMGGGKLEKRRQIEERIISTVKQRAVFPPLDYTICKFGEIKADAKNAPFQLLPGDVLDGTTTIEAAANVLLQAVAYQPAARNSTFCATGSLPPEATAPTEENKLSFWDGQFLRIDGPELLRIDELGDPSLFVDLTEYIEGWSDVLVTDGKGLTTPIVAQPSTSPPSPKYQGVTKRSAVKLLFLPTATGRKYMSKAEEAALEKDRKSGYGSSPSRPAINPKNIGKDGGIEVVVEVTVDNQLRVRAKRCNYPDDVIIKELSEETILSRLRKAVATWADNKKK